MGSDRIIAVNQGRRLYKHKKGLKNINNVNAT